MKFQTDSSHTGKHSKLNRTFPLWKTFKKSGFFWKSSRWQKSVSGTEKVFEMAGQIPTSRNVKAEGIKAFIRDSAKFGIARVWDNGILLYSIKTPKSYYFLEKKITPLCEYLHNTSIYFKNI